MIKIIICPHCGKLCVAVPAKSEKDGIQLICIDDINSDLSAGAAPSAKEQNTKNNKEENK